VGTLIGLALLVIFIFFILKRYRRMRHRAMRDSDFGTFRHSMFMTPRSSATPTTRNMAETNQNVTPSNKESYAPYPATTAKPPSQILAAATATTTAAATPATPASGGGGVLQERPKYVYGQNPTTTNQQEQQQQQEEQQHDDAASDTHGGVYSSQPQIQSAYNAEAYGGYAKYEDVSDGIVGSVPPGTAVYQDAQRAYQGQQGYDQRHYASYDRSQYQGYGQQQQASGYSASAQPAQAYATRSNGIAY
jgi:hypothetical protein